MCDCKRGGKRAIKGGDVITSLITWGAKRKLGEVMGAINNLGDLKKTEKVLRGIYGEKLAKKMKSQMKKRIDEEMRKALEARAAAEEKIQNSEGSGRAADNFALFSMGLPGWIMWGVRNKREKRIKALMEKIQKLEEEGYGADQIIADLKAQRKLKRNPR